MGTGHFVIATSVFKLGIIIHEMVANAEALIAPVRQERGHYALLRYGHGRVWQRVSHASTPIVLNQSDRRILLIRRSWVRARDRAVPSSA